MPKVCTREVNQYRPHLPIHPIHSTLPTADTSTGGKHGGSQLYDGAGLEGALSPRCVHAFAIPALALVSQHPDGTKEHTVGSVVARRRRPHAQAGGSLCTFRGDEKGGVTRTIAKG